MDTYIGDITSLISARIAEACEEVRAGLQPKIDALTAQLAAATRPPILIGARSNDMAWKDVDCEVGPLRVTRLFYGTLPTTFTRQDIPKGVRLIVSYKTPTTNVAAYVKSIPADADVELVFHHEPEGDYSSGSTFVAQFNAQQKVAHDANPAIPFAFIAGAFQYGSSKRNGYSGAFIPPAADRYYLDTYQQGISGSPIQPAQTDPAVQRYLGRLLDAGHPFHGFTEYGRGMTDTNHPLTDGLVVERLNVFAADAAYLRSLPDVRVWSYWYTTDLPTGKQWRLTDAESQQAWRSIARA